MKEDSAKIEAEALAEIKQALGMGTPPASISIPSVVKHNNNNKTHDDDDESHDNHDNDPGSPSRDTDTSLEQTASMDTNSIGDEQITMIERQEEELQQQQQQPRTVPVRKLDDRRDSFTNRLTNMSNISMGSFSEGQSSSQNSSQRFYIGSVPEEEEGSVMSKVSLLEADDMSHDELMELLQRLYENLKKSDAALTNERKRRNSREKSLIRLAKELSKRKEAIMIQMSHIQEMTEELRMVRAERDLLDQRLEYQLKDSEEQNIETREGLEKALETATARYEKTNDEHQIRIDQMHADHGRQCDQLCLEVVQANQESVRLEQQLLAAQQAQAQLEEDRNMEMVKPSSSSSSPKNRNSMQTAFYFLVAFVIMMCATCARYPLLLKSMTTRSPTLVVAFADAFRANEFMNSKWSILTSTKIFSSSTDVVWENHGPLTINSTLVVDSLSGLQHQHQHMELKEPNTSLGAHAGTEPNPGIARDDADADTEDEVVKFPSETRDNAKSKRQLPGHQSAQTNKLSQLQTALSTCLTSFVGGFGNLFEKIRGWKARVSKLFRNEIQGFKKYESS